MRAEPRRRSYAARVENVARGGAIHSPALHDQSPCPAATSFIVVGCCFVFLIVEFFDEDDAIGHATALAPSLLDERPALRRRWLCLQPQHWGTLGEDLYQEWGFSDIPHNLQRKKNQTLERGFYQNWSLKGNESVFSLIFYETNRSYLSNGVPDPLIELLGSDRILFLLFFLWLHEIKHRRRGGHSRLVTIQRRIRIRNGGGGGNRCNSFCSQSLHPRPPLHHHHIPPRTRRNRISILERTRFRPDEHIAGRYRRHVCRWINQCALRTLFLRLREKLEREREGQWIWCPTRLSLSPPFFLLSIDDFLFNVDCAEQESYTESEKGKKVRS